MKVPQGDFKYVFDFSPEAEFDKFVKKMKFAYKSLRFTMALREPTTKLLFDPGPPFPVPMLGEEMSDDEFRGEMCKTLVVAALNTALDALDTWLAFARRVAIHFNSIYEKGGRIGRSELKKLFFDGEKNFQHKKRPEKLEEIGRHLKYPVEGVLELVNSASTVRNHFVHTKPVPIEARTIVGLEIVASTPEEVATLKGVEASIQFRSPEGEVRILRKWQRELPAGESVSVKFRELYGLLLGVLACTKALNDRLGLLMKGQLLEPSGKPSQVRMRRIRRP